MTREHHGKLTIEPEVVHAYSLWATVSRTERLSSKRSVRRQGIRLAVAVAAAVLCFCSPALRIVQSADDIPIFDAHNQYDAGLTVEEMIVPLITLTRRVQV